jgi:hypothetical protein
LFPAALAALAAAGAARSASAVDHFWDLDPATPGSWSEPTNWNPDDLPNSLVDKENAFINNGGTAVIDATQNVTTGALTLGGTYTDPLVPASGTLRMTGGTLRTNNSDIRVGGNSQTAGTLNGTGVLDQSGGDIIMGAGNLNIGISNGAGTGNGTYNMSGGTLKVDSNTIMAVGNRTVGTVNQTAGSIYVRGQSAPGTGQVNLARNTAALGATGTYTLSGGDLTAAQLRYGNAVQTSGNASSATFNLQGTGVFTTGTISVINTAANATNAFNFTGGTLTTNTVNIPLTNNGGTLSPATLNFGAAGGANPAPDTAAGVVTSAAGTTTFSGANTYTQTAAGALALDIVSATSFDKVVVGGAATLDGRLDIRPAAGFNSPGLQAYQVMTFPFRTGTFSTYSGYQNAGSGLYYAPIYSDTDLQLIATLPGDVNTDGAVNGTDFAILAGNFGKTGQMWRTGDFNLDGSVNGSDFALLAGNFGKTVTPGALVSLTASDWASLEAFGAAAGVPVPEPTSLGLLAGVGAVALLRRRRD